MGAHMTAEDKTVDVYIAAYMDSLPSYVSRSEQSIHLAIAKATLMAWLLC